MNEKVLQIGPIKFAEIQAKQAAPVRYVTEKPVPYNPFITFYGDKDPAPVEERAGLSFEFEWARQLMAQYRMQNHPNERETFEYCGRHTHMPQDCIRIYDTEILDDQNVDSLNRILTTGQPDVSIQIFDPLDPKANLPQLPLIFGEACHMMVCDEVWSFGPHPENLYAFITRREAIGPDIDTRAGEFLHYDKILHGEDGMPVGTIKRAWNCCNRLPSAGYKNNASALTVREIINGMLERRVYGGGDKAALEFLKKIGTNYTYKGENKPVGFLGQSDGWLHCAQDISEGFYINGKGERVEIREPFLRNMASLLVLKRDNYEALNP